MEMPGYGGEVCVCSGCLRLFSHQEIILIDLQQKIAFCKTTVEDCIELWRERIGNPVAVHQLVERRFHGNT